MEYSIYISGYCPTGNGPAAAAFIVYRDGNFLYSGVSKVEQSTTPASEYEAACVALTWLVIHHEINFSQTAVELVSSQETFVQQTTGTFATRSKGLIQLHNQLVTLQENLQLSIVFTRRRNNKTTLELARQFMSVKAKSTF